MAKAISEVFLKSVKADLEISFDEEIQGEDILTTRASPREVEAEQLRLMAKSQKCIDPIDLDALVGKLLNMSYSPALSWGYSHESKSHVLSSNKTDLQKEETVPNVNLELISISIH